MYQDYYSHEIFNPTGDFELTVYSEILKVAPSAITLDTDILCRELTALNVELFGLAWLDYNYQLSLSEKQESSQFDVALVTEIMFAKSFLETTKSGDIWSAAGFYNDIIRKAAIAQNSSRDWAIFRDFPAYYDRGVKLSAEKEAEQLLNAFHQNYKTLLSDEECVIRLSNRCVGVTAWRDGIMIPHKLSSAFAERLSFIPNSEATLLFQRLVVGLYNNARHYINAVIDYGSWELARKAAIDLRQWLLEAGRELLEKQNRSDKPELP